MYNKLLSIFFAGFASYAIITSADETQYVGVCYDANSNGISLWLVLRDSGSNQKQLQIIGYDLLAHFAKGARQIVYQIEDKVYIFTNGKENFSYQIINTSGVVESGKCELSTDASKIAIEWGNKDLVETLGENRLELKQAGKINSELSGRLSEFARLLGDTEKKLSGVEANFSLLQNSHNELLKSFDASEKTVISLTDELVLTQDQNSQNLGAIANLEQKLEKLEALLAQNTETKSLSPEDASLIVYRIECLIAYFGALENLDGDPNLELENKETHFSKYLVDKFTIEYKTLKKSLEKTDLEKSRIISLIKESEIEILTAKDNLSTLHKEIAYLEPLINKGLAPQTRLLALMREKTFTSGTIQMLGQKINSLERSLDVIEHNANSIRDANASFSRSEQKKYVTYKQLLEEYLQGSLPFNSVTGLINEIAGLFPPISIDN